MRLALIGDLHLDERSPRFAHVQAVLDAVLDDLLTVRRKSGDRLAVIFLGDLWEAHPSPAAYAALLNRVWRLGLTAVPRIADYVALIQGNHEHPEALRIFDGILWPHVTTAWFSTPILRLPGVSVLLWPYPRRGRPPVEGCEGPTIEESHQQVVDRITRSVATAVHLEKDRPLLVAGHFTVAGARTRDTTFEVHRATEPVIPVSAFSGSAGVFTGHVHAHSVIQAEPPIVTVGSLIAQDFSEVEPKGYVLVTVDEGRVSWVFRPVPARPVLTYEGEWGAAGWMKEPAQC